MPQDNNQTPIARPTLTAPGLPRWPAGLCTTGPQRHLTVAATKTLQPRQRTTLRALGLALLALLLTPCPLHAGSITGAIPPGKTLSKATAVNRQSEKQYPGTVIGATGKFVIDDLPPGTYDCLLDFGDARLEGLNFQVPPSDYEEEQPLSDEDRAVIKAKVLSMNKFEDQIEVMAIQGNIQHAVILLNKLRTKEFYAAKPGEIIWRAELWHFERPEETWLKVQDEMFIVLYRQRIQRSEYDRKSVTFDPRFGGLQITDSNPRIDVGTINPPVEKRGVRLRLAPQAAAEKGETEK